MQNESNGARAGATVTNRVDAGRRGPSRGPVVPAVLALLVLYPSALVAVASRSGPGISPDSVMYVSAARSLAESGQLTAYTGEPLSIFPPGLSVVLGLLASTGLPVQLAAVLLNLVCVALVVGLTYLLATELLASRLLGLLCAAVVSVSISTARVYSMVYSEPLFVVLSTAALLVLTRAIHRERVSWAQIGLVAALVSVACSLRFIGFTLIPVVAVGVWLASSAARPVPRLVRAGVAAALSATGLVAVALRNLVLGSSALGDRYPSGLSVLDVVRLSLRGLGELIVPNSLGPLVVAAGGLLMVALVVAGAVVAVAARRWGLALVGVFTALYWATLSYSQISTQIDPVNERLLAPVFTPMVVLAVLAGHRVVAGLGERLSRPTLRTVRIAVAVVALGGLAVSSAAGAHYAVTTGSVGRGFNRTEELRSPLAAAVRALPPDAGIASNNPAQTYWTTGQEPVAQIPLRSHYSAAEQNAEATRRLVGATETGAVDYLTYVDPAAGASTPDELRDRGIDLHLVATFTDGSLWQVDRP